MALPDYMFSMQEALKRRCVIPLGSTAGALSSARWETLSFRPMGLPESRAADVPYRSAALPMISRALRTSPTHCHGEGCVQPNSGGGVLMICQKPPFVRNPSPPKMVSGMQAIPPHTEPLLSQFKRWSCLVSPIYARLKRRCQPNWKQQCTHPAFHSNAFRPGQHRFSLLLVRLAILRPKAGRRGPA